MGSCGSTLNDKKARGLARTGGAGVLGGDLAHALRQVAVERRARVDLLREHGGALHVDGAVHAVDAEHHAHARAACRVQVRALPNAA